MKHFLSFLLLAGCVFSAHAQTAVENKPIIEVLKLKESSHDFGKIQQGRPVTYVFEIVNTGKEPLRLDNVQASCGCTTPEWPKEAIQPGATAPIKVGYNAAAEGSFHKTVTIQFNAGQTKVIEITGNVFKSPATSAPTNSSISLLKQINQ
jgi:hypothetical protein